MSRRKIIRRKQHVFVYFLKIFKLICDTDSYWGEGKRETCVARLVSENWRLCCRKLSEVKGISVAFFCWVGFLENILRFTKWRLIKSNLTAFYGAVLEPYNLTRQLENKRLIRVNWKSNLSPNHASFSENVILKLCHSRSYFWIASLFLTVRTTLRCSN